VFINASADNITVADSWQRAPLDEITTLAEHPVALIGDGQQRMGMMSADIRLLTPGLRLAGTILPVQAREGDNLAIHRALDEARTGDVLVVNGNGETSRAVFGDLLGEICLAKGLAGVVIDGATRDIDELAAMKLPVFARGTSPAGPWKNGPGIVGRPVACGNVVCNPGDAIIGDSDGIIVVERTKLAQTLAATRRQDDFEAELRNRIRTELG
jgi:regulator of RNase E activity RraA